MYYYHYYTIWWRQKYNLNIKRDIWRRGQVNSRELWVWLHLSKKWNLNNIGLGQDRTRQDKTGQDKTRTTTEQGVYLWSMNLEENYGQWWEQNYMRCNQMQKLRQVHTIGLCKCPNDERYRGDDKYIYF